MKPEEQPPVKVGEIKRALAHNEKLAKNPKEGYGKDEGGWSMRDDNLYGFNLAFEKVLPFSKENSKTKNNPKKEQIALKDYIENTLTLPENEKHDLTAIEFGGPGSELFGHFNYLSPDFFKQTIGVCLKDIRSPQKIKEDEGNHHTVIEENILEIQKQNNSLLEKIKKQLGENKIDLIISRLGGAILSIDRNGAILDRLIRNWYKLLNDNGLMFIQFSYGDMFRKEKSGAPDKIIKTLIEKWVETAKKLPPEIDIQVGSGVLRLHKRKGSPEELPNAYQLFNK